MPLRKSNRRRPLVRLLHPYRAAAPTVPALWFPDCNDIRIVKRMDKGCPAFFLKFYSTIIPVIIHALDQTNLCTITLGSSTFEIGAPSGRQIRERISFLVAANATPCAWFPAEHAITPLSFLLVRAEKSYSMHHAP